MNQFIYSSSVGAGRKTKIFTSKDAHKPVVVELTELSNISLCSWDFIKQSIGGSLVPRSNVRNDVDKTTPDTGESKKIALFHRV